MADHESHQLKLVKCLTANKGIAASRAGRCKLRLGFAISFSCVHDKHRLAFVCYLLLLYLYSSAVGGGHSKVWFADIPQYEIFDCITFTNYNPDVDYWLKISKPKGEPQEPTFPKLSETLTDWIIKESLTDENGTPTLRNNLIKNRKTTA